MPLTIIGDVHGKIPSYLKICSKHEYTIQLGDMGFRYDQINLDPKNHIFFPGNHENFHTIEYCPNYIGRYGVYTHGGVKFFYVGGAFSIDISFRVCDYIRGGPKTWDWREELTLKEMMGCLYLYKKERPDIVISHTCPTSIEKLVGNRKIMETYGWDDLECRTSQLLQIMLEEHAPKEWVFGHFHVPWKKEINKTKFRCVPELGVYTCNFS